MNKPLILKSARFTDICYFILQHFW